MELVLPFFLHFILLQLLTWKPSVAVLGHEECAVCTVLILRGFFIFSLPCEQSSAQSRARACKPSPPSPPNHWILLPELSYKCRSAPKAKRFMSKIIVN